MRLGMNKGSTPPNKAAGYGLIAVGAVIMLLAVPLYLYVAVVGGVLAYLGYTLRSK